MTKRMTDFSVYREVRSRGKVFTHEEMTRWGISRIYNISSAVDLDNGADIYTFMANICVTPEIVIADRGIKTLPGAPGPAMITSIIVFKNYHYWYVFALAFWQWYWDIEGARGMLMN